MPERKADGCGGTSRRAFLKAGAAGACALCLAGIWGCTAADKEKDDQPSADQRAKKGLLGSRPSPWFSRLNDDRVRCRLCPQECELAVGERAPCRVRENRGGVGYTLAYGNPALVQEDPVERIPFYHISPGARVLSISTAGCNLQCKFCQVWDMALVDPEDVYAYNMSPEKIVSQARSAHLRAVSYAFGEPVIFYEYMEDTAALAKEAGLLNLVHTAGYIQPEPLQALGGMLDGVNVDLKSFDAAFYREVVGGELKPVLETLQLLREAGIHLEITTIVIPTLNDDLKQISDMSKWILQELGADVPLHFARFYPLYRLSALPRTPVSTLDNARDTAREAGLNYVYVAKVTGHPGENTYCPGCQEQIIRRVGFVIDQVDLEEGRCRYCGLDIPGRWT